jgi:2-succinyl-5-enolpyruvyl-6-hydroxy-3-cyclohexene-1-carboxylate synthase
VANRGANGIDGVISTAVGVALAGGPTVALVGDLAFLHDTNALLGAAQREVSLTVVVVDNDGGGIFSFLPQAAELSGDEFEQLFGTPHGLDLMAVARAHGVDAAEVTSLADLRAAVAEPARGIRVRVVRTDRQANVAAHQRLYDLVAEALG